MSKMDIFYQKYRPQKIADLDLTSVRETLGEILRQKNIPHAFLFAGPKGTGKTSSARIVAKSLNCPHRDENGEPCNRCDICQEISRGESLDVLEIDAASNRGIDDIRALKEKVNLQPLKAKNKVYIIDEVHMLTNEAFNAILKTLEEPPEHVYFIFCTTNPEKIPETVLSRLTRVDFHRATHEEVMRSLKRVVKGEKLTVDKRVLEIIAQVADGSCRDAHKILYQLWLENKGKITAKKAQSILEKWQRTSPWHLLELLGERKTKEAVLLLENLLQEGIEWQEYGRRLLETIRDLLLVKVGREQKEKPASRLKDKFSYSDIVRLGEIFQEALQRSKTASLPQLPFQLAVISFGEKETAKKSSFSQGKVGKTEKKNFSSPASSKPQKENPSSLGKNSPRGGETLEEIEKRWGEILEVVKPMNHSVNALLRACRPFRLEGERLVVEVFYQFHKDQLEQERNRQIVQEAFRQVLGRSLQIIFRLGKKPSQENHSPQAAPVNNHFPSNNQKEEGGDDELYEIAKEIFGE